MTRFNFSPLIGVVLLILPGFISASNIPQDSTHKKIEQLQVGVFEQAPYMFKDNKGNWDGMSIRLWRNVADDLNYSFDFQEIDPETANNSLKDKQVDILLLSELTTKEDSLVDFSHIYYTANMGAATSPAMDLGAIIKSFFSKRFWIIVLVLSVLLLIVGTIMYFVERRSNDENFGGERSIIKGIGSGFWWAGVTMTTIGYGDKAPVTFWGRVIALFWMLIAMAVTAVLTASLVSAVMGSSSSKKMAIPTDLKDMKVLALQESKASTYLEEERVSFQKVSDLKDGLQLVNSRKADVILHNIPQLNYYINSDAVLSLRVQPILLNPRLYAMGIRNKSKLREDLNRSILKVIQTSQWQRELDRFIPDKR